MQDIYIAAERDKPEVDFKFSKDHLALRGESFPENALTFYGPLVASVIDYLDTARNKDIVVDIELRYFNSSSTKILLNLFRIFDLASENQNVVHLNWYHDNEDDTILEFGNDIAEDFISLRYTAIATA